MPTMYSIMGLEIFQVAVKKIQYCLCTIIPYRHSLLTKGMVMVASLVPRPHLPNDRKGGRRAGTFWHVTDVKGTCPWLRVSPSFRLLRAITKSCVSTTFRGVYANGKPRLCRRNLTSVTCQNVPGPPPAFPNRLGGGAWERG